MSHVCLYQATWQNDFIKSSLCESTPSTTILLFHHALYTLLRNNNKHDPALVRGLPVNSWIIDIVNTNICKSMYSLCIYIELGTLGRFASIVVVQVQINTFIVV